MIQEVTRENTVLRARLYNWKFSSAVTYLDGETEDNQQIVHLLSSLFGNCGWFDGRMADMIEAIVGVLLGDGS